MALAYPKLTADAREEIACDHFTNALSYPDLALKVKERTPETLDDASVSYTHLTLPTIYSV